MSEWNRENISKYIVWCRLSPTCPRTQQLHCGILAQFKVYWQPLLCFPTPKALNSHTKHLLKPGVRCMALNLLGVTTLTRQVPLSLGESNVLQQTATTAIFPPVTHQDGIADTCADSRITITSLSSHFFDWFGIDDGDVWLDWTLSHY
jgi:hypothetical protein